MASIRSRQVRTDIGEGGATHDVQSIHSSVNQYSREVFLITPYPPGYHFIDIPLLGVPPIRLPTSRRMRQFLTDFDEPRRFLEIEDSRDLDVEPCGELDVTVQQIGAGGDSKFLPEVMNKILIP